MAVDYRLIMTRPSDQNVLDLFAGEWSTRMPAMLGMRAEPGAAALLEDPRIYWAAEQLGPFYDRDVIELGPLEGAHSYMLQRLGAKSVTAVEANTRAFLKCLCVKEIFGLDRVHYKLGNFYPYLEQCRKVDVIVASGVLYHMTDPLRLLGLITEKADKVFLWTHYFDADVVAGRPDAAIYAPPERIGDGPYAGARRLYAEAALSWNGFSGGADSYAFWLTRDSILGFLESRGYTVGVDFEQPDHPNGPAFAICAKRPERPVGLRRALLRKLADLTGRSTPSFESGDHGRL